MKKLHLKESATQYTVTRNRYGDLVLTAVGTVLCLYRNIDQLTRGIAYREDISIIGMFWFDPTATVKIGDVVGYQNQLYRIEGVVTAKNLLTQDQVQFFRCTVSIYRAIS